MVIKNSYLSKLLLFLQFCINILINICNYTRDTNIFINSAHKELFFDIFLHINKAHISINIDIYMILNILLCNHFKSTI